jgi:hypothetical protein
MKKILLAVIILIVLISIPFYVIINNKLKSESKTLVNAYRPPEGSNEELYQDIFLSLLEPHTEKAISDFYSKYLFDLPGSAPYFEDVLSVKRIGDEPRTFDFLIKLEVAPYIGPHNSVGIDHITFRVQGSGEVTLEKFEHIKSFEIAPNYQYIIKQWPPQ